MNGTSPNLPSLDANHLIEPVQRMLDAPQAQIKTWQLDTIQPLTTGTNSGIYRVHGPAMVDDVSKDWVLILKVLCPPAARESAELISFYDGDPATDPGSLLYWKREAQVYESGLLNDVPAYLRGPRCLGVYEPQENEVWIWLEEVKDVSPQHWSIADFRHAALMLGRFNGAYIAGQPIPDAPWLVSDWLRRNVARASIAMERLLQALDHLPQTFCHHDAHRFNLFVQENGAFVAIDWSVSGIGPIGEEAGLLAGVAVLYQMVDLAQASDLDRAIFDGYLEGLRDTGWNGDPRDVRLGYTAEIALKIVIAYLPGMLWSMLQDFDIAAFEAQSGSTVDAWVENHAERTRWMLERGIEALEIAVI